MAGRLSRREASQRRRSRGGRKSGSSSIWMSGGTGSSSWRSGGAFRRETHSRNPGSSGRGDVAGAGAGRSELGRRLEGGRGRVILCPLVSPQKCKGRSRNPEESRTTQTYEPALDPSGSSRGSAERTGCFLAHADLARTKKGEKGRSERGAARAPRLARQMPAALRPPFSSWRSTSRAPWRPRPSTPLRSRSSGNES